MDYNKKKITLLNYLPNIGIDNVKEEIITCLQAEQKYILPKFFYDGIGSELFEKITHLEEYYLTRTEKSILASFVKDLDINFENLNIVELGSGDPSKISLLLQQIPRNILQTINYFPVDISRSTIEKSISLLDNQFSLNKITGVVVDFVHQLNLIPKQGKRLFCFFGSTIGNFNKQEIKNFILHLSNEMQNGDELLLGLDMLKDITVLKNAYNDKLGVTAKFNKNILSVVNNLTGANFNPDNFEHNAYFNTNKNRIEMHLKALKNLKVKFASNSKEILINKDETIHTENSHKFTEKDIKKIADIGNFRISKSFTDKRKWFKIIYFRKL